MSPLRSVLSAAVCVFSVAVLPAASEEPSGALWYRIEIDGRPAGWSMERISRSEGRVTTTSRLALRLRRGATELEIEMAARFVETDGGEPVLLWRRQTLGSLPVESTFRFRPDGVESTTRQAGREIRELLPGPRGSWLPPDAARRATVERRRAGETTFTLRTVDPLQGLEPVRVELERLGPATTSGAVDRWRESTLGPVADAAGQEAILELDDDGRLVTSSSAFMGMELSQHRTDRRRALTGLDDGTAPELMISTFVRPDRPIPSPRRLRRAVYELSLSPGPARSAHGPPGGDYEVLPLPPTTRFQRAERLPRTGGTGGEPASRDRIRIVVDAAGGLPAPPVDADGAPRPPDRERHLAASSYLDHEDPSIRELLTRLDRGDRAAATGPSDRDRPPSVADGGPEKPRGRGSGDPGERAVRLAALVHRLIDEKTLDTGFATASEVARTGSGDCTEHAVLLAALLRADGIPSRIVSGLVYLEELAGARDVFGYHMWTQALIDGRWLDLDATAVPPDPAGPGRAGAQGGEPEPPAPGYGFDATHIALAASALDGADAAADFLPLTPLIGRLEVRVVEFDPFTP